MPAKIVPLFLALTLVLLTALAVPAPQAQAAPPKVDIYVTSWCPYCAKAKAYFEAKGIPYTTHDIEKNPSARMRFQSYGQQGVPLVVIGETVIPGYSVAEYEKALAGTKTAAAQPKMIFGK